ARGHYLNVTPLHIFGFNRSIATSFETIFNDGGGVYSFPSSALVLSLVSSAADTCVVCVYGLDSDWLEISENVTLTGTTPVTTTKSFFRVNGAYVVSGTQSGNVSITNNGTKYAYIEALTGVSQACILSTSATKAAYITNVHFSSGTVNSNKYLVGRAYIKENGKALQRFWQSSWAIGAMTYDVPVPFKIPPKTDFALEAMSSSGENEISVYINGFVIDDE
ncbi:MAG: hypothetical protein ACO222_07995, partial [Polynucleobacter sp.]